MDPAQADPKYLLRLVTTTMPFGKYQGRLIADLPSSYLAWFTRQGMPRGELGHLLLTMYEIDRNGLRVLLDPLRRPVNGFVSAPGQTDSPK